MLAKTLELESQGLKYSGIDAKYIGNGVILMTPTMIRVPHTFCIYFSDVISICSFQNVRRIILRIWLLEHVATQSE